MSKSAVEISNQMLLVIDKYKAIPETINNVIKKDGLVLTNEQKLIAVTDTRDTLVSKLEGMAVALAIVCEEGE